MPRTAYGYARVSLETQVDGFSLEAQKRVIEAICTAEGFELAHIYVEEAVSGSVPISQRPEGARMLAAVRDSDIIVSLKLDRCFRDVADASATLANLQRRGVGLYLKDLGGDVTASSVSALVFNLLASVAAFERQRISERTSEAMRLVMPASCARRKAEGRHMGGLTPFGFTKVDRRQPGAAEPVWCLEPVELIHAEARCLKASGVSLRNAAKHFQAAGFKVSHCGVKSLFASL